MDSQKITLVSVACTKVMETLEALKECQKHFDFYETLLLTHIKIEVGGIKVIKIPKLDYFGYNKFVAMELRDYIDTEYCLLVQNDGYILNPEMWTDEFLNWDYIGAPWPSQTHFTKKGVEVRVGNGGFSFRSKKLLEAPSMLDLEFTDMGTGYPHEDGFLCNHYRHELEEYGVKFAPVEVAARFSTELIVPETTKSFGFHRYKPT